MARNQTKIFVAREHEEFSQKEELVKCIEDKNGKVKIKLDVLDSDSRYNPVHPQFLGLHKEDANFTAHYYLGLARLDDENAIAVLPKVNNIDFIAMFAGVFDSGLNQKDYDYFADYFGFDYEADEISFGSSNISESDKDELSVLQNNLSPLLMMQFLAVLQNLVKKGLKKGYVLHEENLKCKVKGHILFSQNLRKNIIPKREDRAFCRFQEYTADIPENRLLKKALIFTRNFFGTSQFKNYQDTSSILQRCSKLLTHFENVRAEINLSQIRSIRQNALFKDHAVACKIARDILRRFDYSIENIGIKMGRNEKSLRPFWIDMPRLYEMFILRKLRETFKNDVEFQVQGYYGSVVDFILKSQKLILDAKYKPKYGNSQAGILSDIREIAGYARDEKILEKFSLKNETEEIKCVIIFPSKSDVEKKENDEKGLCPEQSFKPELTKENLTSVTVNHFRNFYFYKIDIPIIPK